MTLLSRATEPRSDVHHGTCHRCGWKGPVTKVTRHDRRRLETGRSFGRLCEECMTDLAASRSRHPTAQPVQPARLRAVSDRDVA
jgi:hypothetical protein